MAKFPVITLPCGTEFVLTSEVPLLIADALYPDAKFLNLPVLDLYKIANKSDRSVSWIKKVVSFSHVPAWYTPLSVKDYQVLQSIWLHLPKLEYPISREDWKPYANAFAECGTEIGFDLKENCIEWLVEPNGYQQQFFEQNKHSQNIVGMWMNDDSKEEMFILQCGMAEMEHIVLLREAIRNMEIMQLDPITHAPTPIYRPFGRVSVNELSLYLYRFNIALYSEDEAPTSLYEADDLKIRVSDDHTVPSSETEVQTNVAVKMNPPGKLPRTSIGKFAIQAAWLIECDTGKAATAKQVIEMLQSWVDLDYPELLEKVPHGVKWATSRSGSKIYGIDACAKALDTWNKSRP